MFRCKINGHCIDYHYYCDGIANCLDDSDEFNCHNHQHFVVTYNDDDNKII